MKHLQSFGGLIVNAWTPETNNRFFLEHPTLQFIDPGGRVLDVDGMITGHRPAASVETKVWDNAQIDALIALLMTIKASLYAPEQPTETSELDF